MKAAAAPTGRGPARYGPRATARSYRHGTRPTLIETVRSSRTRGKRRTRNRIRQGRNAERGSRSWETNVQRSNRNSKNVRKTTISKTWSPVIRQENWRQVPGIRHDDNRGSRNNRPTNERDRTPKTSTRTTTTSRYGHDEISEYGYKQAIVLKIRLRANEVRDVSRKPTSRI